MLPILRIIPVGGVLLAIAITVLALSPPDGARSRVAHVETPARGPLLDRGTHPEWRQLLIRAAFKRAGELERLREIPDTPARSEPAPDAGEPAPMTEAEPAPAEGPEALAMETPADHADAAEAQPEPSAPPLPANPVLPVESSEVTDLQPSAASDDHASTASAVRQEPTRVATLLDNAALPIRRSDAIAMQAPALADDASTAPAGWLKPNEAAPLLVDATTPIGSGIPPVADEPAATDGGSTAALARLKLNDIDITLLLDDALPPVDSSNDVTSHETAAPATPSAAPSADPATTAPPPDELTNVAALPVDEGTSAAQDESQAVDEPEDGSPDAVDTDEATPLEMPVVLPRVRPRVADEPPRKRRPVRRTARHVRPVRTAANDPATFNFFEALFRMLAADGRPPDAASSRRMSRPLY